MITECEVTVHVSMDYCGFTYTSNNVLFGSFLCISGIVLKGQQNRPKDRTYLVLVVCGVVILILCKELRLTLRSDIKCEIVLSIPPKNEDPWRISMNQ